MTEPRKQLRTLSITAVALLLLLGLSVLLFQFPLGRLLLLVGLGIAATKAALVAINFMHLRTSTPLMRLFAGAGLLWLTLLLGLTAADILTRQPITP